MFQTFDNPSDPSLGPARLAALRAELQRRGLDGFLIPLADEHQGEYIPDSAKRLAWLTGFAGSAGLCVVMADKAAVFVDGRYTLQVTTQVDTSHFTPRHLIDEPPTGWLKAEVKAGQCIGYDAWLHTSAEVDRFRAAIESVGGSFEAVSGNPVDAIWTDRPEPPLNAVEAYPEHLAGEASSAKIARIAEAVKAAGAEATVLTQPDSIAWLLNIRGSDVTHTPLPLSFAIVPTEGRPQLFIDGRKLSNELRDALSDQIDIAAPLSLTQALGQLGKGGRRILLEKATAAAKVADLITAGGGKIVDGRDPVVLPKARKNVAELAGTRAAHIRDGAAMVRFLAWFDREAPKGELDEISAAEALEEQRRQTGLLRDISFDTISGAGPNGAIVHYRVNTDTNRPIRSGELYLIDSGAQYQDGTTDITRTLIVGEPTAEMRDRFTRVLKGHIRLATLRFPKGTNGGQIDVLARAALWEAGLDYDHGTGHGVGVFLSVHETAARISKMANPIALEPGMIISNEPGYYRTGAYGIRIENLIVVTEPQEIAGGERPMMGFETITLAPIDRRLIAPELMSSHEIDWLNAYHARVRKELEPLITSAEDRGWLAQATTRIG